MNLPWQNRQTLAAAADLARDVRTYPVGQIATRLYQLPAQDLVTLTVTLAALVDLSAPIEVGTWSDKTNAPKPPQCPGRHPDHRSFRLENGRWWRCRDCDRERTRKARKAAAINQWRAA